VTNTSRGPNQKCSFEKFPRHTDVFVRHRAICTCNHLRHDTRNRGRVVCVHVTQGQTWSDAERLRRSDAAYASLIWSSGGRGGLGLFDGLTKRLPLLRSHVHMAFYLFSVLEYPWAPHFGGMSSLLVNTRTYIPKFDLLSINSLNDLDYTTVVSSPIAASSYPVQHVQSSCGVNPCAAEWLTGRT